MRNNIRHMDISRIIQVGIGPDSSKYSGSSAVVMTVVNSSVVVSSVVVVVVVLKGSNRS